MKQPLALLTALFTLAFVLSPLVTDPFSGFRADQLPVPQVDPPVQPAGYAFAIWGLIYGWLVVSAGFGLWARANDPAWDRMRAPLLLSLAVGTPWLWIANQSPVWATVTIFIMAGAAILAALRSPGRDRWLAHAPVTVYAGWLTAASFVSLGSTAAGHGVLTGALGWAWLGLAGATLTGLAVIVALRRRLEYALTLAWALIGIIVANGGDPLSVSLGAALAIALVAGVGALLPRASSG
ncbi:hypothetical protein [Salibaculum sp.]|uniref:hypothetical protein n=1 Tax=Salibaculum sp. TaxID=2855480 RepID=UPI002B4A8336|nr:hypothetical protein [Salibaculum sp.]HKL68430.1 hypothetical protein [Salibaculum sp.]